VVALKQRRKALDRTRMVERSTPRGERNLHLGLYHTMTEVRLKGVAIGKSKESGESQVANQ